MVLPPCRRRDEGEAVELLNLEYPKVARDQRELAAARAELIAEE